MVGVMIENKKIKILMLSDHPLSVSGVGTQSRYLIDRLLSTGRYTFRCFGAAVKHDNLDIVKVNDDFIIKPTNGFGDKNLLRMTLAVERPDVLFLFTDPRFFTWCFEMEDEIHQICPIAYNHLWDELPFPKFNEVIYESTDLINCINWPTYEMCRDRWPEKTNYIPHAVPKELFSPLPDEERMRFKQMILGKDRLDHFIVLFVGRNARRKCPSDIIMGFKMFLERLKEREGHTKASLVMHADPLDPEGPNLHHVLDMLEMREHVVFSNQRVGFKEMNALYNIGDTLVNFSLNEGFGLPVLEMKMCGKPVIAIKTGGLTRQVKDHETVFEYGVAIEPDVKMLVGNQTVPYIFEDACTHKSISNAIEKIYLWGPEERKQVGTLAREHALKNYDLDRLASDWDRTLTGLVNNWKAGNRPKRWACKEI